MKTIKNVCSATSSEVKEAMEILYTKQYRKFFNELQQRPELLRHSDCRFCDGVTDDSSEADRQPKLSQFCLVLLARDDELASRAVELVDSLGLWDRARCALFLLVDFCCSSLASPTDEAQLARLFARLSRRHPDACARLLSEELTADCLTPLEYAAARDCFHLATAFANAPGYLIREREHPTDPSLLVEEVDLSRYSSSGGDRFLKSPFVKFVLSAQQLIGDKLPPSYLCFFKSPVAQAYFSSIGNNAQYQLATLISLAFNTLTFIFLLATLNIRIFTMNTFNSSVQVKIPGQKDYSLAFIDVVSPEFIASYRYLFYIRISIQVFTILSGLYWIAAEFVNHYTTPKLMRQRWKGLLWIKGFATLRGCIFEGVMLGFFGIQIAALVLEQLFFLDPSSYFQVGRDWFVESVRLQLVFIIDTEFMVMMMLLFACKMAGYCQTVFYVLHCLNACVTLIYIICLPLLLVGFTMLLNQPYVTCQSFSWVCAMDYLGRTFRYTFTLGEFSGISDYLVLWPQAVVYLWVAVFLLNFGVGLLTQQIAVLQENVEVRQAIFVAYVSQQYAMSRWSPMGLLRPKRPSRFVLTRGRVNIKSSSWIDGCHFFSEYE